MEAQGGYASQSWLPMQRSCLLCSLQVDGAYLVPTLLAPQGRSKMAHAAPRGRACMPICDALACRPSILGGEWPKYLSPRPSRCGRGRGRRALENRRIPSAPPLPSKHPAQHRQTRAFRLRHRGWTPGFLARRAAARLGVFALPPPSKVFVWYWR